MTTTTRPAPRTEPYDSFELALLAVLKDEVEKMAASNAWTEPTGSHLGTREATAHRFAEPGPAPSRGMRRHSRWRQAVGVAAAIAAVAIAVPLATSTPAYAIGRDSSGNVTVTITRLDDAAGLERELVAHGVTARVTYLPAGYQCDPRDNPPVPGAAGIAASVDDDGLHFTIPRGAVGADQTLLIDLSTPPQAQPNPPQGGPSGIMLGTSIAAHPVAPCRAVNSGSILPLPGHPGTPDSVGTSGGVATSGTVTQKATASAADPKN